MDSATEIWKRVLTLMEGDLTSTTLAVPGSAKSVLFYLLILIIPGVCLVGGIAVWARRRHK